MTATKSKSNKKLVVERLARPPIPAPPVKKTFRKSSFLTRLGLEQKAADMAIRGEEVHVIAKSLDLPVAKTQKILLSALTKSSGSSLRTSELYREVLLQRSNQVVSAWIGRAIGDEARIVTDLFGRDVAVKMLCKDAAEIVRQEGKFQAELIGAYAPKKTEQKVEVTNPIDEQIAKLLEERRTGTGESQPRCQVSSPLEITSETRTIDATEYRVEELADTGR